MNCWKCGKELGEGHRFCSACGADQSQAPTQQSAQPDQSPQPDQHTQPGQTAQPVQPTRPASPPQPTRSVRTSQGTLQSGLAAEQGELILKIFSAVCGVLYAVMALLNLYHAIRRSFSVLSLFSYSGFFYRSADYYYLNISRALIGFTFYFVLALIDLWMCGCLAMMIWKRTPRNSDPLFLGLCAGGIVIFLLRLVYYPSFRKVILALVGALLTLGGIFLLRWLLLGEMPLRGKSVNQLQREIAGCFSSKSRRAAAPQGGQTRPDNAQTPPQGDQTPPPPQDEGPVNRDL